MSEGKASGQGRQAAPKRSPHLSSSLAQAGSHMRSSGACGTSELVGQGSSSMVRRKEEHPAARSASISWQKCSTRPACCSSHRPCNAEGRQADSCPQSTSVNVEACMLLLPCLCSCSAQANTLGRRQNMPCWREAVAPGNAFGLLMAQVATHKQAN